MSKRKGKISVNFIGEASDDVTGSCVLIETDNKKILLECGLYQDNTILESYKINSRKFDFKAKEIDYLFLNHAHADHTCLTPKLIKNGFEGKIILTHITAKLIKFLLPDSANIIGKDARYLSKKSGKIVEPLYGEEDVENTFDLMYEYECGEIHKLDEEISFRFLHNSHIIGATQLELFIKDENSRVTKILYTSDLGSMKLKKSFVEDTEFCTKANLVITESTYGNAKKNVTKKDREKDIEKIRTVVEQVCIENKGRILIPSFSLDRSQYMLKVLYDLFGKDDKFNIPIIIDSPLTNKITNVYKEVLDGENKKLIEDITSWKNVKFITETDESKACVVDKKPKIVISSSGMLTSGRSVNYLRDFLPNSKDMVIFIGFSSQNTLASKIKNNKEQRTITIDKVKYPNICGVIDLRSFSSHIQKNELIDYMKNINTEKIVLVHGNKSAKLELKKDLEEELDKMCSTTKVICCHKGMIVKI